MKIPQYRMIVGRAIVAAALACCLWIGIPATQAHPADPKAQLAAHFTIADFDGDQRADFASVVPSTSNVRNTRYWIAFHLSGGTRQMLSITAPSGGLQIATRDVNGDSFPDVIVTTEWTHQPVAVLLNDGSGKFTTSEAAEFLGAFAVDEECFTVAIQEVCDASAALGWRGTPTYGLSVRRRAFAATACRLASAHACSRPATLRVSLFNGRAPPYASA